MKEPLRCLSMGWGVQSFTIAAMMALDELPRVDVLIHSDTEHEKQETYEFARQWTPWLGEHGLTVATVRSANTNVKRPEWRDGGVMIPVFTIDKAEGTHGQITRQCTGNWKVKPIRTFVRAELERRGIRKEPGAVEMWMGISADEWPRIRTSDVKYITNVYPLVDRNITRNGCLTWLAQHGFPTPPKSACTFCPYHSIAAWKELKRKGGPERKGGPDWDEAVAVDAEMREVRRFHEVYVHPYRVPLEEAVHLPEDDGQLTLELGLEQPCDSGHCWT